MLHRRDFTKQTGLLLGGIAVSLPLLSKLNDTLMEKDKHFEVIIIGGSYSGLSAAMTLGRAMRKVLIIDNGNPCNRQTPYSHNFLTHDGKPPKEITRQAIQQVRMYDSVSFVEGTAIAGMKSSNGFEIQIQNGEIFSAPKLIFATGIKDIMPDIPGLAESWGISVLHCPYCHGYEVRHQKTGILANGDEGFELSSLISNWTSDLTLYTNGRSLFTESQTAKLNHHHINIVETTISRIESKNGYIRNIVFNDGTMATVNALYARLPFLQHSSIPQTLGCELTAEGYIKVDAAQETTVQGIYACGDNVTRMRTIANAVSMGTTAGMMINKELIKEAF